MNTVALTVLSGCATHEPMYHWGNYQPAVWAHFKPDDAAPQKHQAEMEKTVEEARSEGKPLPPGFQAHLGLLYLANGQAEKAQLAFQTEETQFPESRAYMGFLLKNFSPQQHAPAVTPPLAPPPEAGLSAPPAPMPSSPQVSSGSAP